MKLKYLGLIALICMAAPLCAAETVDFNATTWANNGPYSLAGLKDKVAVLYFFDLG